MLTSMTSPGCAPVTSTGPSIEYGPCGYSCRSGSRSAKLIPNLASFPQCVQVLGYWTVSPGWITATGLALGSRYPERTVSGVDWTMYVLATAACLRSVACSGFLHPPQAPVSAQVIVSVAAWPGAMAVHWLVQQTTLSAVSKSTCCSTRGRSPLQTRAAAAVRGAPSIRERTRSAGSAAGSGCAGPGQPPRRWRGPVSTAVGRLVLAAKASV